VAREDSGGSRGWQGLVKTAVSREDGGGSAGWWSWRGGDPAPTAKVPFSDAGATVVGPPVLRWPRSGCLGPGSGPVLPFSLGGCRSFSVTVWWWFQAKASFSSVLGR
jgi:hypothetical protein